MRDLVRLSVNGAFTYKAAVSSDQRGRFSKLLNLLSFSEIGFDFKVYESFYTQSKKGDVRGMHLQSPPCATSKVVVALEGVMFDVILDLRTKSPTFGQHAVVELNADENTCLYVPAGVAHGFQSLTPKCSTLYYVDGPYSQKHDIGIRYDSFGVNWPLVIGDISPRDLALPLLARFNSPFL
jgi:dTDP-4-dehydrorhamnose 3,5-epimerase